MLFRLFRKFKKSISLLIVLCITIPLIGACGEAENKLEVSRSNSIIGVGGSIEAYTTYSQAKFVEMDMQTYHSYLISFRDFILVVLPEGKDAEDNLTGYPDQNNLMFQAAYNGVTPYSEQIVNGNFTFKNPEYKLLIYYVLAEDFLSWENDANAAVDKSFVGSALDLLGPSDADNYETNVSLHNGKISAVTEANVISNEEEYNLKNVVNKNNYVSECDFLRVEKNSSNKYAIADYTNVEHTTALSKCGSNDGKHPNGKNVIADVANGDSDGVTLLFGGGGLTGYFTDNNVKDYNFNNAGWIGQLLQQHGGSMENYISEVLASESINDNDLIDTTKIQTYAEQMSYKFKYDLSLLGRVNKINYNTLLDINATATNISSMNEINDIGTYSNILRGDTNKNNGTYIAFTTAQGFTLDRGNIVMQSGADLLFNTNFLEMLTQMDACTNRTLSSYIAEVLANVGIVAGGIAVGVGAAATVAGTLAAIGAGSLTVPGVGWIVGGALLLVAGAAALYYSSMTKKSIDDANSANFCEVYKEAIDEIIKMSRVKIPIYHYDIKEDDEGYTTELCYEDYVEVVGENGEKIEKCGHIDGETNQFVQAGTIPAFKMADVDDVKTLGSLSGSPSIRLYSEGKLVDEIYGAGSTQYLYSILDSWGVTAAANMRYYATKDDELSSTVSVYDLLGNGNVSNSTYCFSLDYGKSCVNGIGTSLQFNDGVAKIQADANRYNDFVSTLKEQLKNPDESSGREKHSDMLAKINEYKSKLNTMARYMNTPVSTEEDVEENLTHIVTLNGKQYSLADWGIAGYMLTPLNYSFGDAIIYSMDNQFEYDGLTFNISDAYVNGHNSYSITLDVENELNIVINEINGVIGNKATNELNLFKIEYLDKFNSNSSVSDLVNKLVSDYIGDVVYYSEEVPIYITVSIVETDSNGLSFQTDTSTLYDKKAVELTLND